MSMSTVLVVGEDTFPFHAFEPRREYFEEMLSPVATVETTTDRTSLSDLTEVDVVLDYLTDSTLSTSQMNSLLRFVHSGGGYLPVHCAADLTSIPPTDSESHVSKREEPIAELRELIGGRFLTHPETCEFEVTVESDHPVTNNVDDFCVYDEPYQVEWDDSITVLARMNHPTLEPYPVLWVTSYGSGRVCYCSLGHTDEALTHESVRRLVQNAVSWLTAH